MSYRNTFLINEQTIKERTVINENVDSHYIQTAIYKSQNIDLHQLIGTRLLERLCDLVASGDIELTENVKYKALLDAYIEDYLAFKVVENIQLSLFAKIRNAGVVNYADNTEANLSLKDLQFIIDNARDDANFFGERITNYLVHHSSEFPEYCEFDCKEDDLHHNSYQSSNGSIYLG